MQTKRARFIVSRNGEPAAVILAIEDYLGSLGGAPGVLAKLQAAARKRRLNLLSMKDIDAEVAAVRREKRAAKARRG